MIALTAKGLGVMMGCIFQSPKQASAMAGIILLPLMMFGGLYSNFDQFPAYIGWLQYVSPFKYGFQAVIYNQLNGVVWFATYLDTPITMYPLKMTGITMTSFESIGYLAAICVGFYSLGFIFLRLLSSKISA